MSEALNRLLKVLIIAINAQTHSEDMPSPPPGLGMEITCVHIGGGGGRLQSDCAFIAIINTFRSLFKASDTFHVFFIEIEVPGSRFIYFTLFTQH